MSRTVYLWHAIRLVLVLSDIWLNRSLNKFEVNAELWNLDFAKFRQNEVSSNPSTNSSQCGNCAIYLVHRIHKNSVKSMHLLSTVRCFHEVFFSESKMLVFLHYNTFQHTKRGFLENFFGVLVHL